MTPALVVETSVTVKRKSSIQDYVHTHPTYEMTPGFKPFTNKNECGEYTCAVELVEPQ